MLNAIMGRPIWALPRLNPLRQSGPIQQYSRQIWHCRVDPVLPTSRVGQIQQRRPSHLSPSSSPKRFNSRYSPSARHQKDMNLQKHCFKQPTSHPRHQGLRLRWYCLGASASLPGGSAWQAVAYHGVAEQELRPRVLQWVQVLVYA